MRTRAKIIWTAVVLAIGLLGGVRPASAADGTWNSDSSGNWGDSSKWLGSIVADGAGSTATFANVFSTDSIVTNEIDRTIGSILYLDTDRSLTINGTNTFTLDDPSGTSLVYNVYKYLKRLAINVPLSGTCAFSKTGPGWLSLTANVTNTYTGGTIVNEGTLEFKYDYNLGDPASAITFNDGTVKVSGNVVSARPMILASGTNIIEISGNGAWQCNEPVSGPGGLVIQSAPNGGHSLSFNSLSNTFVGVLGMSASDKRIEAQFASLADSPGAGNIIYFPPGDKNNAFTPTIAWKSTATNALLLDNRRIELAGSNWSYPNCLKNGNATYPIIINTDFLVSGSGYKHFVFDANNANVTNVIAGDISDGTNGAVVAMTFSGAGDLILSGNNTYSGTNTFSGSGTLFLEGEASLPDDGTLDITGSGKVQVSTREKIGVLLTNGVSVVPATGIWGSSASGAENTSDTYFSGTGLLYVGLDFPPEGMLIIIR